MRKLLQKLAAEFSAKTDLSENDSSADLDVKAVESDIGVRRFGFVVITLVFIGFGSWALFAPLQSYAVARGVVQVEGDKKIVQHLEGGIVDEILIGNGDYVSLGQPLLLIKATTWLAEERIIGGRLWATLATLGRLKSERDGLDEIEFDGKLSQTEDDRARLAMDSERALFQARRSNRAAATSVIEQKIMQLEERILGDRAVMVATERVATSLKAEIDDLRSLLADGYVDKQRIRQLERGYAETLGEISRLSAAVSSAEVAIDEARLTIVELEQDFITQVVDDLRAALDVLYELEKQKEVVSDRVARATVRAPSSGYVLALQPKTEGEVVKGGQHILSIVPDIDQLVVSVQMSPMDIDRIEVGQEAEVRFSVFKDAYTVTGYLRHISADSLIDEVTGANYFEAKVELLESDIPLLSGYRLVPGMPAEVFVKTGNRSLVAYLTSPLRRMFENSLVEE